MYTTKFNHLTLKQLYGYSFIKWKELYNELYNLPFEEKCSFCHYRDIHDNAHYCFSCNIDNSLCNNFGNSGLFQDIIRLRDLLLQKIDLMIINITENYYSVKYI